eukprot:TRINITY_DN2606_c1_g1_i1.p1 TRINITY_DN2606_c1_g1~~TRINITY_DN2606_c1_g1_i1.p1  ORF type:complete len:206 (-),score=23.13 TRINITY_DN2606_c1_g1_i1:74-691(-)
MKFILFALLTFVSLCFAGPSYVAITAYTGSACENNTIYAIEYVAVGECFENRTISYSIEDNLFIEDIYPNSNCSGTAVSNATHALNTCDSVKGTQVIITLEYALPEPIPQIATEAVWLDDPACPQGNETLYTQLPPTCVPTDTGSEYWSCYHSAGVPYRVSCSDNECKKGCISKPVSPFHCVKVDGFWASFYCSDSSPPSPLISQ